MNRNDDDGQVLLLVLAYTVITALLVTVVVDVSKAYLYRRSLLAAADAAALTAANQPDLAAVYRGTGQTLPLSPTGTRSAVQQYARDADLGARFQGFIVVGVETDGTRVTVHLHATLDFPFARLAGRWRHGFPVDATASARSPLAP